MDIDRLTRDQFQRAVGETDLVILPVGAVEQHGPHLPLGTDFFHAQELARAVARRTGCLVAPALTYGVCRSTALFPGSLTIRPETLKALALDVGAALFRQGLRRLLMVTGHAGSGHMPMLIEAGEALRDRFPGTVIAVVNVLDLLTEVYEETDDLITDDQDGHAGEVETSLMIHLHPDLVRGTAEAEYPTFPKYILSRDPRKYWPGGVWGDPTRATRDKGEQLFQAEVEKLVQLIDRMRQFAD
ncbi:MAG: creatininase family protein [Proteobacteria bacterium]|nr:creatininase family protein [Pseudomonadota bacterium]